ncbi:polysaccharide biosynthesis tyrosine autokinase [Ilumatobacter sp.]|uniref:polysaccharide biosynthesis tyrosine autokinase n=2 Tax=Ilumatobacter sp. TaxID=1967498 RepID=UPI0037523592
MDPQAEMTLRDYARVVLRRKWVVIAAVMLTTTISVVSSAAQTPVYSSSSEVLVQPRGQDGLFADSIVNLNDRAIQTEIQVIEGQAVRQRVQDNLQLEVKPPGVHATAVGSTDVISLTLRSTNATNAATLANAYANAYIEVRREQSVGELLAATTEVQTAIDKLQADLDALADEDPRRNSLLAQLGNFNTTLDQLRVDAALRTGGATIIREAQVSEGPVEPTPARTAALAFVVGLLLGLGAAFLLDYLDDKIRSEDDLQRATNRPVLAVVPIDVPPNNLPIAMTEPDHDAVEAYRGLRTNLQFLGLDSPLKVVQLTSSLPGEGKTTTAVNLAVVLAQAGHSVALVDADLRRPRVHQVFALPQTPGFTDLLLGAEAKETVNYVEVDGGTVLNVFTSGRVPSNPSEMLSGQRIRKLLAQMGDHYDYVIVDSAPVLPVSDSVALAGAVDGLFVVAHAGRVTDGQVAETIERLDRISAPLLGLVLNQAAVSKGDYYAYGGYTAIHALPTTLTAPPKGDQVVSGYSDDTDPSMQRITTEA